MKIVLMCLVEFIALISLGQTAQITSDKTLQTIQTAQSGNWTDASTWSGGILPGAGDNIEILSGHILHVNASVSCGNIQVNTGGKLQLISPDTLQMGDHGGGDRLLQVDGTLEIANGLLELNGRLLCQPNSVFMMTGGLLRVDGNAGTAAGSVPNGNDLLKFPSGMQSFQFSGGFLNIVDPPFGNSGNALNSSYDFGQQSTVRLGDSLGSNSGSVSFGFGSSMPGQIGHLSIYYCQGAGSSHYFKLLHPLIIKGNCTIEKGYYIPPDFWGQSSCMLRANLQIEGNLKVGNSMTLGVMDTSIVTANLRVAGNLVIDTAIAFKSISSSAISVNGDIINDGIFEVPDLYMANNFSLSPSTHPQFIKGSGQYLDIPLGNLLINNTSNESVALHSAFSNHGDSTLHLRKLHFIAGKFYAGNKTVDLAGYMVNGSSDKYLVLDTGGMLIEEGATVNAFIGTPAFYNPVFIHQVIGNKYEIKLRQHLIVQAATSGIGTEWEISIREAPSFPVDISFQWQGSQEENGFTRNACYVSRYNGNTWQKIGSLQSSTGSDPYQVTVTGLTALSRFTVQSGGILPVHLLSFTAQQLEEKILLQWTSADEENFARYELERRSGQENFIRIATIASKQQTGFINYSYLDNPSLSGEIFYRLKMVDRDGTFVYSHIIRLEAPTIAVSLFPNPVISQLHLKGVAGFTFITIADRMGRILVRRSINNNLQNIDVGHLSAGMYYLNLNGYGKPQVLIFLKE